MDTKIQPFETGARKAIMRDINEGLMPYLYLFYTLYN